MPEISARLARRVEIDFPHHAALVAERLHSLDGLIKDSAQGQERILAAVVRLAGGRLDRLSQAIELARSDWRDLLVAAGLADETWPARLSAWLDPPPAGDGRSPSAVGELVEPDGRRWRIRRRRLDLRVVKRLMHRGDVVVMLGESGGLRPRRVPKGERAAVWETVRRSYAGPGGPNPSIGAREYMGHEFGDDSGGVMVYLENHPQERRLDPRHPVPLEWRHETASRQRRLGDLR